MDQPHAAGKHYSDARVEIGVIKFWGARVMYNVIDRAIQIHGSLGYTTDLPLESMYGRRAARIYDGPDEVHKVTVARQVLKGYRPPIHRWSTSPPAAPPPWRSTPPTSTSWPSAPSSAVPPQLPMKVPLTCAVAMVASSMAVRMSSAEPPEDNANGLSR